LERRIERFSPQYAVFAVAALAAFGDMPAGSSTFGWSMILSENRFPLVRIMR